MGSVKDTIHRRGGVASAVSDLLLTERKLVGFREFILSPDYMALEGVYPFWLKEADNMQDDLSSLVLTGSLGGGKCVVYSDLVSTDHGYVPIGSLVPDAGYGFTPFEVGVEQPDGSFAQTSHFYKEKDAEVLHLRCASGRSYSGTADHPRLAYRVGSDRVELVRCGDLRVGDYIARRWTGSIELYPDADEAKLYCLYGVWLGDGHFDNAVPHNPVIGYLSCDTLADWCREVEGYLTSNAHICKESGCRLYSLPLYRSRLRDFIGGYCVANTKYIHSAAFGSRERAFYTLYGLLITDGYVNKGKGTLGFATVSPRLADGVCSILDYLGLQYSIRKRTDRKYFYKKTGEWRPAQDSYRITISVESSRVLYDAMLAYVPLLEMDAPHQRRLIEGLRADFEVRPNKSYRINCKTTFKLGGAEVGIVAQLRLVRRLTDASTRNKFDSYAKTTNSMLGNKAASNQAFERLRAWLEDRGQTLPDNLASFCDVRFDRIESIDTTVEDVYDVTVPSTHLFMSGNVVNHNTSYLNMVTCYKLYCWFSQGDLYNYFQILRGTPIYFLYFSVSMKAAERSGFKQLRQMIDNAPWFKNNFPRRKDIQSSIQFNNNFSIEFASGESHAIGLNVVGAIIDEANFRNGVGQGTVSEYSEVQRLAQQLEDRMHSRFTRDGGKLISFMGYISSASYQSSFIEEKVSELASDPQGRVINAVQYKICPQNYSPKKFEVFCGYQQISPCIVQSKEHKDTLVKSMSLPKSKADGYFERVPEDLKSQFKKNIYLAIQNHCGRSTAAKGSFITNYDVVRKAYSDALLRACPLVQSSIVVSDQDDTPIRSVLDVSRLQYTDRPHALCLDLSLTGDHGSLCCVRFDGYAADGRALHNEVFNLELVPPAFPGMLKVSKVEDFILWLAEHLNIAVFSTDQFQSTQLRQNVCEALMLPDIRLSLDSSDIPHLLWLSMLVDERLGLLYLERQDREIRESVHDVVKHKVVKRDGSSDDQFQTLVGAFFLSETICTQEGDISSLLDARLNLVGAGNINRMLKSLGYGGLSLDGRGHVARAVTSDIEAPRPSVRSLLEGRAASGPSFTSSDVIASMTPRRRRGGVWDLINGLGDK